ncbi:MAG: META domain-containing protein [Caldilineaceae bacterium]
MKLVVRRKGALLFGALAAASLLLSACTAKIIPVPIPMPAAGVAPAAPAEGTLTLEGVTWQVTELRDAGGTLSPASATATLALENGQVSGSGGCNNFFAGYTLEGAALKFDQAGSTMMACEDAAMAFEQAFLGSLADVASYAIAGQQLHLFAADGTLLLSAVPEVPAAAAAETNPDPVNVAAKAAPVELDEAQDQAASGVVLAPLGVNVRLGPGTDFPILGIAPQGTAGEIVGKSEDGEWWAVSVPSAPNEQGWVAAAYVEAKNADSVPVVAAPPLPEQNAAIQEGTPYQVAPGTLLYSASRILQEGNRVYELEDIYAVPAAGGEPQMVANNAMQPALSPDRATLAFFSQQADKLGVGGYDLNSGRRLRFSAFVEDSQPRWSPTGDRLVFASNRQGDRRWRIYTTPATDKERPADMVYTELTLGKDPDWHPKDDQIVFKGCDDGGQNCGLYLIDADGGNRRSLTNEASDSLPRWLPDGSGVVFMSEGRDGNWDLYRVNIADGTVTRLTDDSAPDGLPAVSPDGTQIAFISKRGGAWGLWVMPAAGGAATQVTAIEGELPDWLAQAVDWAR